MTEPKRRPRLGFCGVGWIGQARLAAVARAGSAEIVGIADSDVGAREAAGEIARSAVLEPSLDRLLSLDLDGVVIATPSALHAQHCLAALQRGCAVFCQKPLARTLDETELILRAARGANRLVSVDFSYRFTEALREVRRVVASGEIGSVYAAELVFHNGYGPDKPWFSDPALSGGGPVIDLGIHLIDAAFWILGSRRLEKVDARLRSRGRPLRNDSEVEDFADLRFDVGEVSVSVRCSWRLHVGREALISMSFFGTEGGAAFHNVDGSFYDFVGESYRGTTTTRLSSPPDDWGGRALLDWVRMLGESPDYRKESDELLDVARAIDLAYGRSPRPHRTSGALDTAVESREVHGGTP